jgi:hypothetical protein
MLKYKIQHSWIEMEVLGRHISVCKPEGEVYSYNVHPPEPHSRNHGRVPCEGSDEDMAKAAIILVHGEAGRKFLEQADREFEADCARVRDALESLNSVPGLLDVLTPETKRAVFEALKEDPVLSRVLQDNPGRAPSEFLAAWSKVL